MKMFFTLAFVVLIAAFSNISAKDNEIVLGAAYENDVWYSFTQGIVQELPTNNWDIAVQTFAQNGGISINSASGVALFVVKNSDGDSWETPIDTNGMSSTWERGYNSIDSWNVGAFNLGMDGFQSGGDFGWGAYDMSTHAIAGNKVFIIKLLNKSYKKIMVESMVGGIFTILVANLDGTNESVIKVKKVDHANSLYTYISLTDNSVFEREPRIDEWDLVFSKYTDLIDMGNGSFTPYSVAGVRTNPFFRTAVVKGVATSTAKAPIINDENYNPSITAIGSSWKVYNSSTSTYSIVDKLTYFVTSELNDATNPVINKVVFKIFEGTSSGRIVFDLNGSEVSVDEALLNNLNVFPSIVDKNAKVSIDLGDFSNQSLKSIKLFNTTGNLVNTINTINDFSNGKFDMSLNDLSSGEYFMIFQFENSNILKKIIVK